MDFRNTIVAGLALAFSYASQAAESAKPASSVEVVFVQPEKFTDCKDEHIDTGRGRPAILSEIRSTIQSTASRYLPAGEYLEVRITDIDLAGDFEPWHGFENEDIRFMREIYPPRIALDFRLMRPDGRVIRADSRRLQSPGFLMTGGFPASDSLRYEKEMLRDWIAREFRPSRAK